jgi:hypothetical protein
MKFFLVSAVIAIIAYVYIGGVIAITNSEPYKVAINFIQSDSVIHRNFGPINKFGFPTGDLNSPIGYSYFEIRLTGELKTEKIGIKLERGPYGVWKVVSWDIL